MQQHAAPTHVSPLATCPEVVHVLLVSVHVFHFRRKLRARVGGEVGKAADALGSGGAGQRPRGGSVIREAGLVTLHTLSS